MRLLLPTTVILASLACYPEAPLNPNAPGLTNTIAGTLVASGIETPGDTFVFVFAASNPGPPAGTGKPLTFATIPADAFSGDASGVQSAAYAVTGLADGEYLVTALMDMDGNFNPLSAPVGGATCGDYAGAHVTDLETLASAPVSVSDGTLQDDVTLTITREIPWERPAFEVPEETVMSRQLGTTGAPQDYVISSVGVHAALTEDVVIDLEGPCAADADEPELCDLAAIGADLCQTAFWVHAVDADGDGVVDPHPGHEPEKELSNVWPRVFLQYLGEPVVDDDGNVTGFETGLPEGESWAGENFPYAVEMKFGGFPGEIGATFPVRELAVTWAPAVRHYFPDGHYELVDLRATKDAESIPAGMWSITVIEESGQTWAVPNDLTKSTATDDSFLPASQGGVLVTE